MALGITDTKNYADIADAIRTVNPDMPSDLTMTPPEMAGYILHGYVDPTTHHWVRPDYLPDLDSIYHGETNTIYMTVDATGRIPDPHISISFSNPGKTYTVEVGHIDNGTFIADETVTNTSGETFTKVWEVTQDLYPVVKFSATNFASYSLKTYTNPDGRLYAAQNQPIVEIIGHMYGIDGALRTPYFTEREKIKVDTCATTGLQQRWRNAYSLQDLYVSDWNTSNWAITTIADTWNSCASLRYLDISDWDTSNWTVNSLNATWARCYQIEYLDLSGWNTSNWRVTTLGTTWNLCISMRHLDISTWDTSNWVVTSLNSTWQYCFQLEELDMSNWDTSNWAVTGLGNTWATCVSLKHLNFTGWDTSGWAVTSLTYTWDYCHSLIDIKGIDDFDTSNWRVTALRYTWRYCENLLELDLHKWDVSDWPVNTTGLNDTWYWCARIRKIDCSTWDTSGWTINSLGNTWSRCYALEELKIEDWDTSAWTITTMANVLYFCTKLKTFPMEKWDTSNWVVTTLATAFEYMYSVGDIDLSGWDTSGWTYTNTFPLAVTFQDCSSLISLDLSSIDFSKIPELRNGSNYSFRYCHNLQNLVFGANNNGKFVCSTANPSVRFDSCPKLTHESILNIFNLLKSGVSGTTCQIGSDNLAKMTAEEKAIATNKGWTLT